MKDKKHIDRLFQEGLKDFEATPNDAVWKNIEAKLQKKKKQRIIPIWWRYAGVAALLLLLLTIGGSYFINTDKPQPNTVVDTETKTDNDANNINKDALNGLPTNKSIITDSHIENNNIEKAPLNTSKLLNTKTITSTESSVAETTDSKILNQNTNNHTSSSNKVSNLSNSTIKTKTVIASNLEETNKNINQSLNNSTLIDNNSAKKIINNTSKKHNTIAKSNEEEINALADNKTNEENTLTIEEAIDKTKDVIEKEKLNRWSITPNVAPVYFNSLGEGSSIDPQFNSNSKTGEVNMSYGISTSYAVNKKLSIRSGINRVNLGYNTNNIVVYRSVGVSSSTRALQNVNVAKNNSNTDVTATDNTSESISLVSGENFISNESPESFGASNTSINQSLGYIEVPIEIQYALLNKKLGINVIGGFSSFFLNNNEIYSEVNGSNRTLLGEATNLNTISYSANFGLGLNYQVSKKIDLNLEPMFKYQINTFNNTSGDFKPYFIGVYTGFAIKF
ncbi:hypothetical protein [Thalassobellus suaedae]|uniref:Outer membrane protein beta-barrel domain-containing protein n=1 Tax=Thalassobellus suaedae TaxID=3074124 RepID=A0ABY9XRP3_9FLAO|nr:hypothetical protein RHP51_15880 [Flavobacteriaceae bacterium HL-DH14]